MIEKQGSLVSILYRKPRERKKQVREMTFNLVSNRCPECGIAMIRLGSCFSCPVCGYGGCE